MKKINPKIFLVLFVILGIILLMLVLVATGTIKTSFFNPDEKPSKIINVASGKIDDWEFDPSKYEDMEFNSGMTFSTSAKSVAQFDTASVASSSAAESTIGFSTGGAKDIVNFRENIKKGYFPLESDITYEGVFYDYYFDTNNEEKEDKMFYPSLTEAVSPDPISGESQYYATVGLNSNIKESDFARKKLNVVVVLDISGSMGASIDNYYYDMNENNKETKTKMKLAEESVNVLIDELNEDDSFGMILFDDAGYKAKPLNKVSKVDMEAIKNHILEIEDRGGTNFEAGYTIAQELFEDYKDTDPNEYENRIIVITDAMPNIGTTSKEGLLEMMEKSSNDKIYTTFIGVGLDFNTEVIKAITDVRGANYYAVNSEEAFKARMGEEFEYMVTPLVFDLDMSLESELFEVEKIYGTDSLSSEKNNIMHVNTLFPSKSNDDGEVKGGVILLKLKLKDKSILDEIDRYDDERGKITIKVSYETRDGKKDSSEKSKIFDLTRIEYYGGGGIDKAIVLSRYVNLIKDWITYERSKDDRYLIKVPVGIIDWFEEPQDEIDWFNVDANTLYNYYYSENERTSVPLTLGNEYREIFGKFKEYLNYENEIRLKDDDINQEVEIIDEILKAPEKAEAERTNDYPDGDF